MINEKVKLIDGTEKEVQIAPLTYRMRNEIMSQCAKTSYGSGSQSADIDLFKLQTLSIERCLKGADLNMLQISEGDRIFNTYCAQAFNMGSDSKNSETTSEEQ